MQELEPSPLGCCALCVRECWRSAGRAGQCPKGEVRERKRPNLGDSGLQVEKLEARWGPWTVTSFLDWAETGPPMDS